MATYVLPTTTYQPPPRVRRQARVTLIEDEIQVNVPLYHLPSKLTITSPMGDDVPTPRGLAATITPATDATSDASSMWSHRSSKSSWDSLYDVTDESEGEEVPLKLSASVKKHVSKESRYPSLVIPSPSKWPSIHKPQNSYTIGLSPASLAPSPSVLSVWQTQRLRMPSGSSTPSLDGSLTSEELALSSCPSTPDSSFRSEAVNEWQSPLQLHPDAFETLHQLNSEDAESEVVETVLEVPEEATHEMKEIVKSTPIRLDFALMSVNPEDSTLDPMSALSVPSPGGFFSSLAPTAAQTWAIRTPEPSTSVAETFYGVPWRADSGFPSERTIVTSLSPSSRGPPTAIRTAFSPIEEVEVAEITAVCQPCDYNEEYQQQLKQSALAHFERTKLWLDDQSTMLSLVTDPAPTTPDASQPAPSTPDVSKSPVSTNTPSKKSVRFAPDASPKESSPKPMLVPVRVLTDASRANAPAEVATDTQSDKSDEESDSIFFDGFQSMWQRNQRLDAWVHRQTRAEAIQLERRNFSQVYSSYSHGFYAISKKARPAPARPVSTMVPANDIPISEEDAAFKETVANAERERQALEQLSPSAWELQALSYLRGGSLLSKEASKHVKQTQGCKILDFGGKANCDWAWQICLEYPNATVNTTMVGTEANRPILPGPANHCVTAVEKPFALPFAAETFDLISARTLHAMLKEADYDDTLAELHRVLKPNGFFEFNLIDSALQRQGPLGRALSVEFGFNLQTYGYDPHPTNSFLPKLESTGFSDVKRTWMSLPMADVLPTWRDEGRSPMSPASTAPAPVEPRTQFYHVPKNIVDGKIVFHEPALTGSTSDINAVTGLVGARMWEQWILRHAFERASYKGEAKQLAQICRVLEEGGKKGSAVTCLMGVARK